MFALLMLLESSDAAEDAAASAAATARSGDAAAAALCSGFGLLYLACIGLISLIGVGLLVFWILMLVDVIRREEADFPGSTGNSKTMWLVILLVSWLVGLSWLAAIVYYFAVKRKAR